jgi:DNA-binding NarL/FixJ family response regulator
MKVIMFTALDDPNAGQAFLQAGAAAFVSKLSSDDLLSVIKRLCADQS